MAQTHYLNFRSAFYGVNFTGKRLLDSDRRQLHEFFRQFGKVTKLFVKQDGSFGTVYFSSLGEVKEALRRGNNVPPLFFKLSSVTEHKDFSCSSQTSSSSSLNGSVHSEMDEINADKITMYDVYGNPVDVFEDENGAQYVPYYQMSKAGYKLYTKGEIEKKLRNNERLINEFHVYMLTKARKFMRENDLILKEETIDDTISRCRQRVFAIYEKKNAYNLKVTAKQNHNAEVVSPKTLRHPAQNNMSSEGDLKKSQAVTLKDGCFQKVLVTHVEGAHSCFVTPFKNVECRNKLMLRVANAHKTSKKAEPHVNFICACEYDGSWYRAKIVRKDKEVEAFFIDDGRKAVISTCYTLPKDIVEYPAQVVLIKAEDANLALQTGITLEVKPVEKISDGYLVEIKTTTHVPAQKNTETTSKKIPPPNNESANETKKTNQITSKTKVRKCPIEDLSSTGVFGCSEIIDSETFVAYLFSDDSHDDLALLDELTEECKANPNYSPQLGDLVAVEKNDEEDEKWVRGLVAEIKNNEYLCALIDYGVTQLCREVKQLPKKYIDIPNFTCLCKTDSESLKQIEASRDGAEYTVASAGVLNLRINDKCFVVQAEQWNPIRVPEQKVYKPLPAPSLINGDVVRVKAVDEEAFTLLCETKDCHERLKQITAHIASYTCPEMLKTPPEVEQLVLSPCEGEQGLFRGVVKSIKSELAEIYFLDYGNSDTVPVSKLRNVDEKLANLQTALIQSPQFWYLKERKWSAENFTYLEENVTKKYMVVNCESKFDLKAANGAFLSKILEDLNNKKFTVSNGERDEQANKQTATDKSLNTSIGSNSSFGSFKQEIPQRCSSSNTTLNNVPKQNKVAQTKFTYNDLKHSSLSPGEYPFICIFCDELADGLATFLLSSDKVVRQLHDLQKKIDAYIANEATVFNNPDEFDLCLAMFEGLWYRGVVVEKKEDSCVIFFVDYGNTSEVAVQNIRNISKECVDFPSTAMICQFEGINEVSEALSNELKKHIMDGELYKVEVISKSNEDERHLIRIPSVYEKIKSFL